MSRAKGDLHSKRSAVASIPFVWALTLSVISASLDRPPLLSSSTSQLSGN